MAKKRKKKKSSNIIGYLSVFVVVVAISAATWVNGISLQEKLDGYNAKEAELKRLIEEEEARTLELEEKKKYIQTKKYIGEVAHEKYGLVYEDEVVFKSNEK